MQAVKGDKGKASGGRIRPVSPEQSTKGVASTGPGSGTDRTASANPTRKANAARSAFQFQRAPSAQEPCKPCEPGYRHANGSVTPQYRILHTEQLDLADAWGDSHVHAVPCIPRALVVRVDLPGLDTAQDVEVDVAVKHLALKVASRFTLELPLPFEVDGSQATAKFDKSRSELSITSPVIPPPTPHRNTDGNSSKLPQDAKSVVVPAADPTTLDGNPSIATECNPDSVTSPSIKIAGPPNSGAQIPTDTNNNDQLLRADHRLQNYSQIKRANVPGPQPGDSPPCVVSSASHILTQRYREPVEIPKVALEHSVTDESTSNHSALTANTCAVTDITALPKQDVDSQGSGTDITSFPGQDVDIQDVDPCATASLAAGMACQSEQERALKAAAKLWGSAHKGTDESVLRHADHDEDKSLSGKEQVANAESDTTPGEVNSKHGNMQFSACNVSPVIPRLDAVYDFPFVEEID
jgi:hypothetical protein